MRVLMLQSPQAEAGVCLPICTTQFFLPTNRHYDHHLLLGRGKKLCNMAYRRQITTSVGRGIDSKVAYPQNGTYRILYLLQYTCPRHLHTIDTRTVYIFYQSSMALWNGNLRNAKGDVAIDRYVLFSLTHAPHSGISFQRSIILVAMVVTYAVQIIYITTRGSKKGISPYFLLFNSIFSNAQLSEALVLVTYAWPNDKKPLLQLLEDRHFRCLAAFGSVLGVLQIAMQWACSTIL